MALVAVYLALLGGVIGFFDFAGRTFSFSYIDGVAVGVMAAGLVAAARRRQVRLDVALAAYALIVAVIGLHIVLLEGLWELVGGSTRFLVPAMLVVGLSQLVPRDSPDTSVTWWPWHWPLVIVGFGLAVSVWTVVGAVGGVLDPARDELYEIKAAVTMPLGSSNYVAAFVLFGLLVAAGLAASDRRWLPAVAVLAIGLIGTLSRGAVGALLAVLVGAAVATRSRRAVAAVLAALLLGGVAAAGITLVLAGAAPDVGVVGGAPVEAVAPGERQVDPEPDPARSPLGEVLGGEIQGRLHLYRTAWSAFLDSPLLGVGMHRVAETNAIDGIGHPNVHNLVLQGLVSLGLLGTLPYLALYALLGVRIARLAPGPARTALLLATAGLLLHAQVEAVAFTRAAEAVIATLLVITGARSGGVGVRVLGARGWTAERPDLVTAR